MRAVLFFILGLLIGACSTPKQVEAPPAREYGHVAEAAALEAKAVGLVATDGTETRAYCSGVWVGDSTILTAHHCVEHFEDGEPIAYVVRGDVYEPGSYVQREIILPHAARLLSIDVAHDLALLRSLDGPPPHAVAHTTLEDVAPGMFVQTMGQPLGLWWSYSSGDVAAVRVQESASDTAMLFVQTTAPTSPGNSGGALFDAWGGIVGVCHGSYTRGHGLHLFIHHAYVDALLKNQASL